MIKKMKNGNKIKLKGGNYYQQQERKKRAIRRIRLAKLKRK